MSVSQPAKPVLYVNATRAAEPAKALLDAYDIDFEIRHTSEPFVFLEWNGIRYTDLPGVADFLFAGRLPIPGVRKGSRGDGALPGSPIRLPRLRA
jgi:hypothetical protein